MPNELLKVEGLTASVDGKKILSNLNLTIRSGETHVLMGPNGAGKSTLDNVIMGNPEYKVETGHIYFKGEEITHLKTDERARRGIFMSFQTPEEIPGITLEDFLRVARKAVTGEPLKVFAFKKQLRTIMAGLKMDESYAQRYLNVGFSGGEKKKAEIVQMLALQPEFAMLDETDSGLDVDAIRIVSEGIHAFKNKNNALLIITHNANILKNLQVDCVHILAEGHIVETGGVELIADINEHGFARLEKAGVRG